MTSRDTPSPHSQSEIAKRLKLLRTVLGKTQAAMADLAGSGSGSAAWAQWESRDRIGLDSALNLCTVLGLSLDWIYRGNLSALSLEWIEKLTNAPPSATRNPMHAKEVSNRLAILRATLNETTDHMAEMIGLRTETWERYEQGDRKIDVRHAARLCAALGVTLDWIYQGNTARLPAELGDKLRQLSRKSVVVAREENSVAQEEK